MRIWHFTSCTDAILMFNQVQHFLSLTVWCLTGRQTPWFTQYFVQKWRIHLQILGHHVQTEQMTINTFATHCILIGPLMSSTCSAQ